MSTITVLRRAAIVAIFGATLIAPAAQASDMQKFTDVSYRPQGLIDAIQKAEARPAGPMDTLSQELKAGDRVEQAAIRRGYARYNPLGLCDKQGRRFWCSVSGYRGDCFLEGQAWVSSAPYYRVRFTNINRECF